MIRSEEKFSLRGCVRSLGGALLLLLTVAVALARADQFDLSIGRLNHAGYALRQHCTATLVAPRVAVTALHCLVPRDVANMHLLLGYDRGDWNEHLQPAAALSAKSPGDIVLLCFDTPGTAEPVPIAARPVERGERVLAVGYGEPRIHVANHTACHIADFDEHVLRLDCPLTFGASGGPVLRKTETGSEIIGVISATSSTASFAFRFLPEDVTAACSRALHRQAR